MTTEAAGQQEERTRVICHLPLNDAAEESAVRAVIKYLESQRRRHIGVDGYTYSHPNVFVGRWWSPERGDWMADRIVLLMVDYKIDLTDPRVSLSEKIAELKNVIHQGYDRYGRHQEEVWVVAYRVTRHA